MVGTGGVCDAVSDTQHQQRSLACAPVDGLNLRGKSSRGLNSFLQFTHRGRLRGADVVKKSLSDPLNRTPSAGEP
jgi:hypothetical protein